MDIDWRANGGRGRGVIRLRQGETPNTIEAYISNWRSGADAFEWLRTG